MPTHCVKMNDVWSVPVNQRDGLTTQIQTWCHLLCHFMSFIEGLQGMVFGPLDSDFHSSFTVIFRFVLSSPL